MILLNDIEIAIITPPHTASRHIHYELCSPYHGGQWVIGPMPDNPEEYDHHVARVPADCYHYQVYLVWRYPLERLVGLYEHSTWYRRTVRHLDPLPWEWFVRQVAKNNTDVLSWLYKFTISMWLEFYNNPQVDKIIRFDRLSQDLEAITHRPVNLQPPNCEHKHWTEYYTKELVATVATWCEQDMKLYERIVGAPYDGLTWEKHNG